MREQHWQDYVIAVIGLYVFMTPWIVPLLLPMPALPESIASMHYAFGSVLMILSIVSVVQGKTLEEVLILLAGVGMVSSPWVLDFSGDQATTWNMVASGTAVVLLSVTALAGSRYPMRPI